MLAPPLPPQELIERVGLPAAHAAQAEEWYLAHGTSVRRHLLRVLGPSYSLEGKRVLDFGCGSGAALRHLVDDGARLWGCEIHGPSVAWLRENLPGVEVLQNRVSPPLELPDRSLDLIYAISVFSHITDTWAAWLLELHRVLDDGGLLVATVQGPGSWQHGVAGSAGVPWDEARTGMHVEHYGHSFDDGWGPAVFLSEWWIRSHWGRAFDVVLYEPWGFSYDGEEPIGQGVVVLRKRDPAPSEDELLAIAPDEALAEAEAALRSRHLTLQEFANVAHDWAVRGRYIHELLAKLELLEGAAAAPPQPPATDAAELIQAADRQIAADEGLAVRWEERSAFFALARRFTPALVAETGAASFHVSTADGVVGRTTFVTREPFELGSLTALLAELPRAANGSPSLDEGTFLDVGANIGTTTVEVLRRHPGASAIAVEPVPENVGLLRQNLLANGLDERATVLALAASDHDGEALLELSPGNSGDHRVRVGSAAGGELGEQTWPTAPTRVARLDSLVESGEIDPRAIAVLWIDAQGHEAHVLAGAERLTATGMPVVIEYWPYGLRRAQGLERLHEAVARRWREVVLVDEDGGRPERIPAADVARLADRFPGQEFTELLLVP